MANLDQDALQQELKKKKICRFCLSQEHNTLTNIYFRDTRIKSSAPLPIQIMAIASTEVRILQIVFLVTDKLGVLFISHWRSMIQTVWGLADRLCAANEQQASRLSQYTHGFPSQ